MIELPTIDRNLDVTFKSPPPADSGLFHAGRDRLDDLRNPRSFEILGALDSENSTIGERYGVIISLEGADGSSLTVELENDHFRIKHRCSGKSVSISTDGEIRPATPRRRDEAVEVAHAVAKWLYDLAHTAIAPHRPESPTNIAVQQDKDDVLAFVNDIRAPSKMMMKRLRNTSVSSDHSDSPSSITIRKDRGGGMAFVRTIQPPDTMVMTRFATPSKKASLEGDIPSGPETDLVLRFITECIPQSLSVSLKDDGNEASFFGVSMLIGNGETLHPLQRMQLIANWTARLSSIDGSTP